MMGNHGYRLLAHSHGYNGPSNVKYDRQIMTNERAMGYMYAPGTMAKTGNPVFNNGWLMLFRGILHKGNPLSSWGFTMILNLISS